jgi:hypothetical protein
MVAWFWFHVTVIRYVPMNQDLLIILCHGSCIALTLSAASGEINASLELKWLFLFVARNWSPFGSLTCVYPGASANNADFMS